MKQESLAFRRGRFKLLSTYSYAGTPGNISCSQLAGSKCGVVFDVNVNNEIIEASFAQTGFYKQHIQYCNGNWGIPTPNCLQTGTIRLSNGNIPIETLAKENLMVYTKKQVMQCSVINGTPVCYNN